MIVEKEIEIRLLDIDSEKFKKSIINCGAKKIDSFLQKRYVYDFNPVIENKWIRLRTNGKETTITIKQIKDNSKIDGTEELEIKTSDFDKTNLVLEELGYSYRNYQENYRELYILDNVEIAIDTWPLLPTYVEFEAKKEEDIYKVLNKIDYDKSKLTTLDVASIYETIYGIEVKNIKELKFNAKR